MMEAEWEEGMERENKPDHVSELTAARETSTEEVWAGKHSKRRERGDRCGGEQGDVERDGEKEHI